MKRVCVWLLLSLLSTHALMAQSMSSQRHLAVPLDASIERLALVPGQTEWLQVRLYLGSLTYATTTTPVRWFNETPFLLMPISGVPATASMDLSRQGSRKVLYSQLLAKENFISTSGDFQQGFNRLMDLMQPDEPAELLLLFTELREGDEPSLNIGSTYRNSFGGGDPFISEPANGTTLPGANSWFRFNGNGTNWSKFFFYLGNDWNDFRYFNDVIGGNSGTTSFTIETPADGRPLLGVFYWKLNGTWQGSQVYRWQAAEFVGRNYVLTPGDFQTATNDNAITVAYDVLTDPVVPVLPLADDDDYTVSASVAFPGKTSNQTNVVVDVYWVAAGQGDVSWRLTTNTNNPGRTLDQNQTVQTVNTSDTSDNVEVTFKTTFTVPDVREILNFRLTRLGLSDANTSTVGLLSVHVRTL